METIFSKKAQKDIDAIDTSLREMFFSHAEKILKNPGQRHVCFGLPFYVEEVTRQARLVYNQEGSNIYIVRCFATHKEYEKWYKSYK